MGIRPPPGSWEDAGGSRPHPIRVLVVDDHPIVRRGIRTMLRGREDVEWVGEAADGAEAIREVARTLPDVVLMDLSMPGIDGSDATVMIARDHPSVKVLILTGYTDVARLKSALDSGAVGVIGKDGDSATVLEGIRRAHAAG